MYSWLAQKWIIFGYVIRSYQSLIQETKIDENHLFSEIIFANTATKDPFLQNPIDFSSIFFNFGFDHLPLTIIELPDLNCLQESGYLFDKIRISMAIQFFRPEACI